jgi:hypothetical protein
LSTTLEAYERIGSRDAGWDEAVRKALIQNARLLAGEPNANQHKETTKADFNSAVSAGCVDPLVDYFSLRYGNHPEGIPQLELARLFADVEVRMQASEYPPIRKSFASLRAAERASKATKTVKGDVLAKLNDSIPVLLGRAEKQLEKLLREPSVNRDSVYDLTENALFDFARDVPSGRSHFLNPLAQFFENNNSKIIGDDAGTSLIEGNFWAHYAWDARSWKWSREVKEEDWKLFGERLQTAAKVLEKAWTNDPADPRIAIEMMKVELGQHQGRERLERWFRRAVNADPDSYEACKAKMLYLEPKWYGSAAEVLEFGRQCLATRNWQSRIPFILLCAHEELATHQGEKPQQYWSRSSFWDDMQALYGACLAANPDSIFDRSGYALQAYRAEKWKLANELFEELGDSPDLKALNCSIEQYQRMRQVAAAKAKE